MSSREPIESVLVRDLLRPEAYGAGVERVTLRTTHASWVFLTETDVFKVKRPVNLGFLDYRTVEDRRRACQEEVRLNARLAPDVYRGVVPVVLTALGYALGRGGGPVVDWAVHMRRLPDEASAAAALARGELEAPALESVAVLLAEVLRDARPAPSFGTPAALAANVEENFDQTRGSIGKFLSQATFDAVESFQRETLARHEGRFLQRIADERIREGHGDIRLEHIYFCASRQQGTIPLIIDAIEFNERFRCGDAAAEIAFPAMELEAAGRADLASGLVARFADASDDYALYGVLDFYVSYRAWVRGKVAAFVAADAATAPEARAAKETEARRCFDLAHAASTPTEVPYLIAVGGVIGSGKSTLAEALGRALAAPVVSSDRTRKVLAGLEPTARGDARLYAPDARDRIYDEILRRAGVVLTSGRGVVVDATFATRAWRARAAAAAEAAGARFVRIETQAPVEVAQARLAARRAQPSASDATETLLEDFLRRYERPGSSEPGRRLTVEMVGPRDTVVNATVRRLAESGIANPAPRLGPGGDAANHARPARTGAQSAAAAKKT